VMLSIILTASVLFPEMDETVILAILGGGTLIAGATATAVLSRRPGRVERIDRTGRAIWRMPPLPELPPARMTPLTRIWMIVLRGYLIVAGGLVLVRIVQLALGGNA
jgi:hypothetical protein